MFPLCGILLLDVGNVPTVWYFATGCWKCSDGVVFCYWTLEMFRRCGILLLDIGYIPTVWYFAIGCWKCSDCVVFCYWTLEITTQWEHFQRPVTKYHTVRTFLTSSSKIPHLRNISNVHGVVFCYWTLEMFPLCGILLLDVRNVLTVWYFVTGCWKCSHCVVFCYWMLEMF
jgi:hypothetical protein